MALWSIRIVPGENAGDPPQFVPQLQPGGPDGLQCQPGDLISWNNTTADPQQPWPTDDDFNPLPRDKVDPTRGQRNSIYLSDEIPPGHSSRPSWVAWLPATSPPTTQRVVKYCSLNNPAAHGLITIRQ